MLLATCLRMSLLLPMYLRSFLAIDMLHGLWCVRLSRNRMERFVVAA